jgi:hypothetical protein
MQTITTIGLDIAKSVSAAGLAGLRNLKSPGAGSNSRLGNGPNWRSLSRPAPIPRCTGPALAAGRSARSRPRSTSNAKPFSLRAAVAQFRRTRRQNVRPGHARGLIRASVAPAARISSSACWMNAAHSRRHPSFRRPCDKSWLEPRCKTTTAAPTAPPESW